MANVICIMKSFFGSQMFLPFLFSCYQRYTVVCEIYFFIFLIFYIIFLCHKVPVFFLLF